MESCPYSHIWVALQHNLTLAFQDSGYRIYLLGIGGFEVYVPPESLDRFPTGACQYSFVILG